MFLNEGQAHLSEELVGWGVDSALIAKIYLDCLQHTSLAGAGSSNVSGAQSCEIVASGEDSLPRRGGMMLFLLYLFQQLGGATYSTSAVGDISGNGVTFLRSLNSSTTFGINNIESASGKSFFDWYKDFVSMLALDATGLSTNSKYNLLAPQTDSFTNLPRNIRVRMSRTDIDGSVITLVGPSILSQITASSSQTTIAGSLFQSGTNAIELTLPSNLSTKLSISADSSLALGMVVVETTGGN